MYFLPFQSRVRFAAFRDTPEVEAELASWLSAGRSWEELGSNTLLSNNLIDGTAHLGVFFKKDKTFITNNTGNPQIRFDGDPRSLLFVHSQYRVSTSSGSFTYEKISPEYTRHEISYHHYTATPSNVQGILNRLSTLETEKLNQSDKIAINQLMTALRTDVNNLAKRNDPLSSILPMLGAEASERQRQIRDIFIQLNALSPSTDSANMDLTNYVNKVEFWDELTKKSNKGYIDGLVATRAKETDFTNHVNDPVLHNPTYAQVGSPSRAEYNLLAARVTAAEGRLTTVESLNPVRSIITDGPILATNEGAGVWKIHGSGLDVGHQDKPQELSFGFYGPLAQDTTHGGGWLAWEKIQIIGIRATLNIAPQGAPVVLDILREGVSLYTNPANRPTFLEGQDEIIATLPETVIINQNEEITVDIVNVGTTVSGEDLNIQVRYQYVE